MPAEFQQIMDSYFPYFFAFASIWVVGGFTFTWYKMKKNGVQFPPKSSIQVLFEEKMASGFSHKSLLTKMGGAKNCLNIIITDSELWINPQFPFNLVGYYYDGIHKINKNNITNISPNGKNIVVEFTRTNGQQGKFELMLKKPNDFLKTIESRS